MESVTCVAESSFAQKIKNAGRMAALQRLASRRANPIGARAKSFFRFHAGAARNLAA
jgi:hypothetical protein